MRRFRPLHRHISALLIALSTAIAVAPSAAESIYKSTLPDGRIVYGGKPEKGAAKVDKIEPAPPVVEVDPKTAEAQRQRDKEQVSELEKRLVARKAAREKAEGDIFAAKDAVTAAEKALATGKEPLPGERVSTADGGSKLSEVYSERIKGLEDEVKAAKERLDKAYRDRSALE
jgi:hypothetical protein